MATIRQIEIFLHLAQVLHFNRAAEDLKISQAALSKEIGKLETSLGCQLFDRSDRWAIRLSSAGRAYQAAVAKLPEILNSAQQLALRAARGERGELSVAIANLMYDYLQLEDVLRAMHEKFPEVKIIIRDCLSSPLVYEQVKSGQADIGFMSVNQTGRYAEELRRIKLMELPMNLAFPKNHPLADKKDLHLSDLTNCNFILPPMEHILMHVVDISHPNFEEHIKVVEETLKDIKAIDKPIFVVFNKIDAYRYEEYDEFSLTPKQQINYTLEEFKNSWIAKENTPCIFISAREKIGIDKLRGDLYKMVAEIHAGRYPFDNFLW